MALRDSAHGRTISVHPWTRTLISGEAIRLPLKFLHALRRADGDHLRIVPEVAEGLAAFARIPSADGADLIRAAGLWLVIGSHGCLSLRRIALRLFVERRDAERAAERGHHIYDFDVAPAVAMIGRLVADDAAIIPIFDPADVVHSRNIRQSARRGRPVRRGGCFPRGR